jgi:hypothetical protein
LIDLLHKLLHTAERTSPDRPLRDDDTEPTLDLVEPGGVGGSEVKVKTGMGGKPPLDFGMLMRRLVLQR